MSKLFLDILNLSIAASWLIAAVLIIRAVIMRKAPKWVSCLLWAVVGLRLLIPFSLESPISLVPSVQTFNTEAVYAGVSQSVKTPEENAVSDYVTDENLQIGDVSANETQKPETSYGDIQTDNVGSVQPTTPEDTDVSIKKPIYLQSGIGAIDDKVNSAINENISESSGKTENTNPIRAFADVASVVWVIGIAVMVIYAVVNYILLRRRVTPFVPCKDGVRRSENVGSPFILGFIRPRIYLPFGLSDETESHIIAHERAHLKRRDHWIKPIGYAILAVYWFNPLVWVAYVLLCRDIEYACDEKVVQSMDANARKAYASALLECGVKRRFIAACPVAFGEIGVKERVKNALSYKKPMLWIIVAAIIITSVVAVLFLTSPQSDNDTSSQKPDESSDTVSEEASDNSNESSDETSNDANGDTSSDTSSDTPSDTPEDNVEPEDTVVYDPTPREIEHIYHSFDERRPGFPTMSSIDGYDEESGLLIIEDFAVCEQILELNKGGRETDAIEFVQDLTPEYFDENLLIMRLIPTPTSKFTVDVLNVKADENGVTLMYKVVPPDPNYFMMTDRQKYLVVVEVKKADILGCDNYEAIVEEYEYALAPGYPVQRTHQTPDDLFPYNDSSKYWNSEITPIYIQMVDIDRVFVRFGDSGMISSGNTDNGYIEQSGLKIWVCTENDEKIDYVYTNSKGLAKFELMQGKYNFYFEGDGTWASKYCGTVTINDKYDNYAVVMGEPRKYLLLTYHDVYENFKVCVTDADTKQPLEGVKVKVSDAVVYTDSNGIAEFKPLLYYVHDKGTAFPVYCEKDGYDDFTYHYAALYATELNIEMSKTEDVS